MFIKAFNILLAKTKDGRSPIYPGSIVEVEDEVGRYFVSVKAAQEITYPAAQATNPAPVAVVPGENPSQTEKAPEGPAEGEELHGVQLDKMSFNELKALAKDMGIETGKIKSKAGMIAAISERAKVGIPADEEPEEDPEGDPEKDDLPADEEPPEFDALDVVDE